MSDTVFFGKAKVTVGAKGCIDCGAEHSTGWHDAKKVLVFVGTRQIDVELHRCDECQEKRDHAGRALATAEATS